jgi:hypothetical protein
MPRSPIALGLVLLARLLISPVATAAPDDLVLVSRGIDGLPGSTSFGAAESNGAVVSADGQRVAFDSTAPNMVPGVTNRQWQVYVRDLRDNTTILVSRADGTNGAPSDNGGLLGGQEAYLGAISADGRYVFFSAVLGDGGYYGYRRDLLTHRTELVTRQDGPDGTPVPSGGIQFAAGNGRYVLFYATGAGLPTGLYLRDLESSRTVLVSRGTGMDGIPADAPQATGISPGGRYVAFASGTPDLTSEPLAAGASGTQVYLRDLRYGTTVLVSRADGAAGAAVPSRYFGLTPVRAGGCIVAFDAAGTGIAPGSPGNGGVQSYVRDVCHGTTRLASRVDGPDGAAAATQPFNGIGGSIEIITFDMSADGRYVLFVAATSNLTPGVSVNRPQVYVRDMVDGRTTLVSRAAGSAGAPDADNTGHFADAVMTPDARYVAFPSKSTNLFAGNPGGFGQIYRRELGVAPAVTEGTGCGMSDDPGLGGSATPACAVGGAGGDGDPTPVTPRPVSVSVTTMAPPDAAGATPANAIPLATEPTLVRAPTLRTVRATRSLVTLWVDLPATIEVRIARGHSTRTIKAIIKTAGTARVRLPKLAQRRYRLTIRALGVAGSRSAAVTRTLDLRKKGAPR